MSLNCDHIRAVPPIEHISVVPPVEKAVRAVPPIEHMSVVPPIEKNRPYCSPLIVLFRGARRKWKLIRSMSVLVAARSACLCAGNNSLPLRRLVMIAIVKTITFLNSATHCPKCSRNVSPIGMHGSAGTKRGSTRVIPRCSPKMKTQS